MKSRQSPLPNLKAKLWATCILDEINNETIPLPGSPKAASKAGNIQEDNDESLYIIGTDVEESGAKSENINYDLVMKWKGPRPDLLVETF